ncbi:MAG: Cu(I)/Ag(I) efflux system membrane fusion protein [Porticoccus sp.]|jgi:Cu(I)/Ag(I) efflux system membrane fusion protein
MNRSMLLVSSLTLVIGIGAGYLIFGSDNASEVTTEEENQPLFYRNPMNPDVTSPAPAKDSMGMNYVPVYADSKTSKVVGTVKIDPVVVQNIGVRTAIAKQTSISRTIRAVGRVDFDEERMSRLHPKVEGWIEEIRVDKTGQTVAKDDILLSIYSPKLVSTQQEYLLALNSVSTLSKSPFDEIRRGAEELVKSSRERLQLLDVPEHQIKALERTRTIQKNLHINSSVDGTVIRIGARQGQFVTPKTELYMMVDLNQVWVYADVYEYELPWVKVGDEVDMTLASVPGKTFKGSLSYIYPYAQSKTRTTKVRLVFDNSELLLRPDMFAEVNIQADTLENVVVIPAEAVIRSGDRTQVFIVRGPGKFEPRVVNLGIESNGQVAVLGGVDDGDEVVTSAQFLVDSESKLREATAKMMDVLKEGRDASSSVSGTKTMDHNSMEEVDSSDMPMTDHSDHATQGAHGHD